MRNGKVRIGIIGCGNIAGSHVGQYKNMEDVEIVALADIVAGRADKFKEKHSINPDARTYTNYIEMLDKEELDGVSVCTYNRQHAPCSIAALKRGVNVVCEKPMCVTLEEGIEMLRAEKESGKILSIGFQPRFHPQMIAMKELVRSGALGKVYYIQTGGGRRRGIAGGTFIQDSTGGLGALGDIGCYALDMVLDAVGYPMPLTVTGVATDYIGKNPEQYADHWIFQVDDFAGAFIRLEGGIIVDFRIAWAMNVDSPGDTIILGTEGGLRIPSTDCWNGGFDAMTLYKTVNGKNIEETIPVAEGNNNCWYGKIRSFVEAIKTGGKSPIPSSDIIKNQAILDGIVRSSKLGKEVKIEIPEI